jgi:hypothetical protein
VLAFEIARRRSDLIGALLLAMAVAAMYVALEK